MYREMTDKERLTAQRTWADVGKKVRCGKAIRTVVAHYDIYVGGVRLDREVEGFVSWNVDALEPLTGP